MLTKDDLKQFTGTSRWYKAMLGYTYTDGVKFLADNAKAYWLIDAVISYQHDPLIRIEAFQVWTLKVDLEERTAVLTMKVDSGYPDSVRQEIQYTDFPLDEVSVWLVDGVLLLPSEY